MYYTINFDKVWLVNRVNEILKHFPERSRIILIARVKHNVTYKELGEEFGISKMRVSQIYEKYMRILKAHVIRGLKY